MFQKKPCRCGMGANETYHVVYPFLSSLHACMYAVWDHKIMILMKYEDTTHDFLGHYSWCLSSLHMFEVTTHDVWAYYKWYSSSIHIMFELTSHEFTVWGHYKWCLRSSWSLHVMMFEVTIHHVHDVWNYYTWVKNKLKASWLKKKKTNIETDKQRNNIAMSYNPLPCYN